MKKPTKADLQAALKQTEQDLHAYQEAFWALRRGEEPVRLHSGRYTIEVLGAGRGCGGVVLWGNQPQSASRFTAQASTSPDPYLAALAREVGQVQRRALQATAVTDPPPTAATCPECVGTPGVAAPMNEIGEVQRCDECAVFSNDEDAAEHLATLLNERHFPDDVGTYSVRVLGGRCFIAADGRVLGDDGLERALEQPAQEAS